MKVILVRHGEIDSNLAKVYSGRSLEPLNDTGRRQARDAAAQISKKKIAAIFASPLPRAVETATIIGQAIGRTVRVSDAFNELRMGPWEGLSEAEVAARFPVEFKLWNSKPGELHLPGRETLDDLQRRAIRGVAEACDAAEDGNVAIVSHVAVIRVLQLFASGRSLNEYKQVHVPNATPVEIDWNPWTAGVPR